MEENEEDHSYSSFPDDFAQVLKGLSSHDIYDQQDTNSLPSSLCESSPEEGGSLYRDRGQEVYAHQFFEEENIRLRQQVSSLHEEKIDAETQLEQERLKFNRMIQNLQQRSRADMDAIRSKQALIEAELPALRRRLKAEKDQFMDLTISDALCDDLLSQTEDELSLKEFVQLRVHLYIRKYKNDLEATRKELEHLRQNMGSSTEQTEYAVQELTHKANVVKGQNRNLERELSLSEASRHELEAKCQELTVELDSVRRKDRGYDELQARKLWLESEYSKLLDEKERNGTLIMSATANRDTLQRDVQDLTRKLDLMRTDKDYLNKQNLTLRSQLAAKTEMEEKLTAQLRQLEQTKAEFCSQMTQVKDENRMQYEQRFEEELKKLQDNNSKELADIRGRSQDMWERENKLLREARDDTLRELDRVRVNEKELQHLYDAQVIELSRMESKHEAVVSELRNELKMKTFEINQVGLSYEDKMDELRRIKLELEMLQQKIQVHKTEFSNLELSSSRDIAQLESQVAKQEDKLKEYEDLETQLDETIAEAGESSDSPLNQTEDLLSSIPTQSKRRFRHSVLLAQKLMRSQKQVEQLRGQVEVLSNENQQLEKQKGDFKTQLMDINRPQCYLVNKITEKEDIIHHMKQDIGRLNEEIDRLRTKCTLFMEENTVLRKELEQSVARGKELQSIRVLVEHLQKKQEMVKFDVPSSPELPLSSPAVLLKPPRPMGKLPKWYSQLR